MSPDILTTFDHFDEKMTNLIRRLSKEPKIPKLKLVVIRLKKCVDFKKRVGKFFYVNFGLF